MHDLRMGLTAVLALFCLLLMTASPIAAQGNGNGNANGNGNGNGNANGNGNGQNGNGNAFGHPNASATPELDSLLLFGTGAAGVAGYGLMRIRAGRRDRAERETATSEK